MAGSLAVVTAKHKSKGHGGAKGKSKHAHPVKRMTIEPDTDGAGFHSETEMHPPARISDNDPYAPGEVSKKSHANYSQLAKHMKDTMRLKDDAEEQGEGETEGGSPGQTEDAE